MEWAISVHCQYSLYMTRFTFMERIAVRMGYESVEDATMVRSWM
jgi:hypothetical protein